MKACQKCLSICTQDEWQHGKYCDSCYKEFEAITWIEEELKKFRKKHCGFSAVSVFISYLKNNIL